MLSSHFLLRFQLPKFTTENNSLLPVYSFNYEWSYRLVLCFAVFTDVLLVNNNKYAFSYSTGAMEISSDSASAFENFCV